MSETISPPLSVPLTAPEVSTGIPFSSLGLRIEGDDAGHVLVFGVNDLGGIEVSTPSREELNVGLRRLGICDEPVLLFRLVAVPIKLAREVHAVLEGARRMMCEARLDLRGRIELGMVAGSEACALAFFVRSATGPVVFFDVRVEKLPVLCLPAGSGHP